MPIERAFDESAWYQQAIDFVRSFEDPVDTCVTVVTLGLVVLDVSIATVHLNVLVEDVVKDLASGNLHEGGLDGVFLQGRENGCVVRGFVTLQHGIDQTGGSKAHRFNGKRTNDHLAEFVLYGSKACNGLTELMPFRGVAG